MFPGNRLKVLPSLGLGKMCINFSRYSNFGGSTLPGRLAASLSPDILSILASQLKEGCILITGTNGKTTTAYLLAKILSQAGKKIIHNRSGANLISGVTTSFIAESTWSGKINADLGVIEVDEASMPAVASRLRVKAAIVTNLFPDQLDRFGELKHILKIIAQGLNKIDGDGFLLLNADDPLVSSIKKNVRTIYYGIDRLKGASITADQTDIKTCYRCGKKYDYAHIHYAHLGIYRCPGCGIRRPSPQYSIVSHFKKPAQSAAVAIKTPTGVFQFSLKARGFYNIYNALAAISCALILGVREEVIKASLRQFTACFGRMETFAIENKMVELALIKNPVGANEVLRTIVEEDGEITLMLAVNDKYADGTDVSWLWDVDFEMLAHQDNKIKNIFCSGNRGEEISLRLKYAGIDTRKIKYEEDLNIIFRESLSNTPDGGKLPILLTYTAMLELRKIINKMGYGKKFWEE